MSEVWVAAAATVAVGAYSANQQKQAAKGAAGAAQRSADAATNEQARQFDLAREDQMPWLQTGQAALARLSGMYGLGAPAGASSAPPNALAGQPAGTLRPYEGNPLARSGGGNALTGQAGYEQASPVGGSMTPSDYAPPSYGPDYSAFYQSPDYQFALNQGLQGLDRSAAARGSLYSGGQSADVLGYASGLATQNFNNYANRLAGLAGIGQTTATNLAGQGQAYANNIGQIGINNAALQSQSIYNRADTNSQLAAGLGGAFNKWYQQNSANNGGGSGWYLGNNPGKG